MRVLHVIPSLSPKEGGPSFAVKAMAEALAREGVQVTIATTGQEETTRQRDHETAESRESESVVAAVSAAKHAARVPPQGPSKQGEGSKGSEAGSWEGDGYRVVCFRRNFESYKISFGLTRWLRENVAKFDLVHIHALFSFSSTVAARIARRQNVPYLVRPLGVLNQWGMQNRRRVPKLISFRLVELPVLINSAAIHYTSEAERKEAALLDARLAEHESAIIPLPVEQGARSTASGSESATARREQGEASKEPFFAQFPEAQGKRIILFLSRIDRKKGLELLLDAFAMVRAENQEVALVIAGDGEESYLRELKEHAKRDRETTRLQDNVTTGQRVYEATGQQDRGPVVSGQLSGGLSSDVIWTGHLRGEMKAAALVGADVFVLPSASENFGIAAAESLAAGVPTIVSEEVALSSDIRQYDAGVVVKRDVQQLARAMSDLLSNKQKATTLAANGHRLVEERYSPKAVGKALHELYQRIIRKRDKGRDARLLDYRTTRQRDWNEDGIARTK